MAQCLKCWTVGLPPGKLRFNVAVHSYELLVSPGRISGQVSITQSIETCI